MPCFAAGYVSVQIGRQIDIALERHCSVGAFWAVCLIEALRGYFVAEGEDITAA